MGSHLLLTVVLATFAFHAVSAHINLEDIADFCTGNFITQDYNSSWEHVQARESSPESLHYFPLASKYAMYATSQMLYQSQNFKILTEAQIENSCIVTKKKAGGGTWEHLVTSGYDKSYPVELHPTQIPKLFRFDIPLPTGRLSGHSSIALTDNKNYVVFDSCFDNGLRSFAVGSRTPYLDDVSLAVIKAHVKSLGFKEKNFVTLNYKDCVEVNGKPTPKKMDDLPEPMPNPQPTIHILTNSNLHPHFYFKRP